MGKFGSFILRIVQLLFAILVLSFSVNAIKWQYYNSVPATTGFAAFAGAFGLLASLIGITAIWATPIAGLFMALIDVLAIVFFLAGGIAFAVGLHGANCKHGRARRTWHNRLLSGGCQPITNDRLGRTLQCGFYTAADVKHRCRLAEADTVFLFLGCVMSVAAAWLCVHAAKLKKNGTQAA